MITASNIMTTAVVSVNPQTPTGEIARLLLENGISANEILALREAGVVG